MARKRKMPQRPRKGTAKQSKGGVAVVEEAPVLAPVVPENNGVGEIHVRKSVTYDEYVELVGGFAELMGWATPVHVGRGIFVVAETITPENALEIIENYHIATNRNKKERRVESYASDMKHDRWPQTHQGIAFSYNFEKNKWEMYDGQNRCQACLTVEKPFKTLISFMPPSFSDAAKPVTDTGANRTIRDAAAIQGIHISTRWPVVVRGIAFGGVSKNFNTSVSNESVFQAYEIIKDSVDFTLLQFNKSLSGLSTKGVMAAVGRAYYHVDHDRLAEFVKILFDGICERPSDTAAARLARWLLQDQRGGGQGQYAAYCMSASAIQSFVAEESIQRLVPVRIDPFPLPDEIEWRLAAIV